MGRRRTTREIPTTGLVLPPQRGTGVDVWAIVSDPVIAAREIETGTHDEDLAMLAHVARTQDLGLVLDAATERLRVLGAC